VATKPHGHGDIHFLLHSSGTAQRWAAEGKKWLFFFQDTNTLYFAHFLATLGVTAQREVAVNMVSVPRKAKEAIGAVCQLTHADGRKMVCNVEYNQLEPLLLASGHAAGDVNDEATGFSPYPGSINGLMYDLVKYNATLATTGGQIDEFINPKCAAGPSNPLPCATTTTATCPTVHPPSSILHLAPFAGSPTRAGRPSSRRRASSA
jgi:UDP-sugar pyrophosphorylase